jgi:carbonic anhydrase
MAEHVTNAVVVHCIDFRIQKYLDTWLQENLKHDNYDRVSLAGSIFDFAAVMGQIEISNRLHKVKKVILVNHEDCGAYGDVGNYERHKEDLKKAEKRLDDEFSHLDVETYYLHLDGTFEHID